MNNIEYSLNLNSEGHAKQTMTVSMYSFLRMYRLNPKRKLGELFSSGQGGCTDSHSGIGNISFVKDLLTGTIVTTKFNCSKFGHHTHPAMGWVSI